MKVWDISMPIRPGMPVYKHLAEKQPVFEITRAFQDGVGVRETRLHLDLHTGTHIDAPLHMSPTGAGIEAYGLTGVLAPCRVLELGSLDERITAADLEGFTFKEGEFILFKTRNSEEEGFNENFVYLAESGARALVEGKVRGVGIDALGIERAQPGHPTHKTLFAGRIMIIEGLRLRGIAAGSYTLLVAPLKLVGVEAAPARVLLIGEELN